MAYYQPSSEATALLVFLQTRSHIVNLQEIMEWSEAKTLFALSELEILNKVVQLSGKRFEVIKG